MTTDTAVAVADPADPFEDAWSAWRTWAVVVALAMLFGLMEAAQLRLGSSVLGPGIPISVALVRVLPYWLLAACAMPLLVVIGRRFRVWHFLLRPNAPALAATALGFAVLALVGRAFVNVVDPRTGEVLGPTTLQLFQTYFALDLLTYAAFVGTLYAFHYYREARRREITASRLQASLAEARLRGLEARIDPDFLFNTLNDISSAASQGQQRPVVDMLERLSEILRAALSDERPEEIRLAQELELLDRYLSTAETSPRRQVSVERDVSPDALGALVPRGLLAPIVDRLAPPDAHNGAPRPHVSIGAARQGDTLRMSVMASPNAHADEADWREHELGLADVRERLAGLYGREQVIEWTPFGESGVSTVITIPFRKALAGEERATP